MINKCVTCKCHEIGYQCGLLSGCRLTFCKCFYILLWRRRHATIFLWAVRGNWGYVAIFSNTEKFDVCTVTIGVACPLSPAS